jgi:hypothetical protein
MTITSIIELASTYRAWRGSEGELRDGGDRGRPVMVLSEFRQNKNADALMALANLAENLLLSEIRQADNLMALANVAEMNMSCELTP